MRACIQGEQLFVRNVGPGRDVGQLHPAAVGRRACGSASGGRNPPESRRMASAAAAKKWPRLSHRRSSPEPTSRRYASWTRAVALQGLTGGLARPSERRRAGAARRRRAGESRRRPCGHRPPRRPGVASRRTFRQCTRYVRERKEARGTERPADPSRTLTQSSTSTFGRRFPSMTSFGFRCYLLRSDRLKHRGGNFAAWRYLHACHHQFVNGYESTDQVRGFVPVPPMEMKGNGTVLEHPTTPSAREEQPCPVSTSRQFAGRSGWSRCWTCSASSPRLDRGCSGREAVSYTPPGRAIAASSR